MTDEELFELVRSNYVKVNKDYLEQQIKEASVNLTDEQKMRLGLRMENDTE